MVQHGATTFKREGAKATAISDFNASNLPSLGFLALGQETTHAKSALCGSSPAAMHCLSRLWQTPKGPNMSNPCKSLSNSLQMQGQVTHKDLEITQQTGSVKKNHASHRSWMAVGDPKNGSACRITARIAWNLHCHHLSCYINLSSSVQRPAASSQLRKTGKTLNTSKSHKDSHQEIFPETLSAPDASAKAPCGSSNVSSCLLTNWVTLAI